MAKNAKKEDKKVKNITPNNAVKKENKKENKDKTHFLKDVKAEMKKVIWPTKKQLINNTVAVIAIVIIVGAIVFLLDFCFGEINGLVNDKVKKVVRSSQNLETSNVISDDSTDETANTVETENSEVTENSENSGDTEVNSSEE